MGAFLKLSVRNIDGVVSKLKKGAALQINKIDDIVKRNVDAMAIDAKSNLPAQYGDLSASINVIKVDVLKYQLRADKDYAAYVEFGTGGNANSYVQSLEPEWDAIAYEFFETGEGNMKEKPYFYPAIKKVWPQMIKEIQNAINARYK